MLLSNGYRRLLSVSVLLGIFLTVSACGYRPLYGQLDDATQQGTGAAALAAIEVMPMRDRSGQMMRTALQRRLNPKGRGAVQYQLFISVAESVTELAVEQNSFATRANLNLTATYHLVRVSDSAELTTGTQRAVASYNIITSEFATMAAQTNARERAIGNLADELQTRLASFFVRPASRVGGLSNP